MQLQNFKRSEPTWDNKIFKLFTTRNESLICWDSKIMCLKHISNHSHCQLQKPSSYSSKKYQKEDKSIHAQTIKQVLLLLSVLELFTETCSCMLSVTLSAIPAFTSLIRAPLCKYCCHYEGLSVTFDNGTWVWCELLHLPSLGIKAGVSASNNTVLSFAVLFFSAVYSLNADPPPAHPSPFSKLEPYKKKYYTYNF